MNSFASPCARICYKTHQLPRNRDAGILRTTSLGYATEPNNYRAAHIMVIDKKRTSTSTATATSTT